MAFRLLSSLSLPPSCHPLPCSLQRFCSLQRLTHLNMWLPNLETCDDSYLVILLSDCSAWFKFASFGILSVASNKTNSNWHKTFSYNGKKSRWVGLALKGNHWMSQCCPGHLSARFIHRLHVVTTLAAPSYSHCGHKMAAKRYSLIVASQINQQKRDHWVLPKAPVKTLSGLTSCYWL